ncbi:MAG: hypothetical protein LAT55_12300 [Opitutales bacterium]|nr:hypothetical protein [Opitutales bacterium]
MPVFIATMLGWLAGTIQKLITWVFVANTASALKTVAIYGVMIASVSGSIYMLIQYVNGLLVDLVSGLGPIGQGIFSGIASFLPSNLPFLVTLVLTYYTFVVGVHISIEIAKLKARIADKATRTMKA